MNSKRIKTLLLIACTLFFFGLPFLEMFIDYLVGDNDGVITKWNFRQKSIMLQTIAIPVILTIWAVKTKKVWLANIAMVAMLWLVLEIIFTGIAYFSPATPVSIVETGSLPYAFVRDSLLGDKMKASTNATSASIINGDTVYNVRYKIDSLSRRFTLNTPSDTSNYAVFFGGSFTFGTGAEDWESIPSLFVRETEGYCGYNYGIPAAGINQMYSFLKHYDLRQQIPEKEGIGFYIYVSDHIPRLLGSLKVMFSYAKNHPKFKIIDGEPQRVGTLRSAYPRLMVYIMQAMNQSSVLNYFNIPNKVLSWGKDPLEETALMIKASKKLYEKQFGNDQFYTVIYPGNSNAIVPYLEKHQVKVIDLSHLFEMKDHCFHEQYEWHPDYTGRTIFIKNLLENLELPSTPLTANKE